MLTGQLSRQEGSQYKYLLYAVIISASYLLISYLLIGFKPEQLFLVVAFDFLYLLSPVTRRLILGFSIFIVFWIMFDYMKAFPNYRYNTVHIESLYNMEKSLFGIHMGSAVVTPNEYWRMHENTWLDVICGFFYLCWIPLPLFFAAYLYYRNRHQFFRFSFTFLLINLIGFAVYYIYPAAPPWYIQLHGFAFEPHTPGNTAGLAKFDSYFQVHVFDGLYAKSSNVFAAMPSLHATYPLLTFYYGLKNRIGYLNILFGLLTAGIWFTAVYTSHHYMLDVLAGIMCAAAGIFVFNTAANRWEWFPSYHHTGTKQRRPVK